MSRPAPSRRAVLASAAGLGVGALTGACRFDPTSSEAGPSQSAAPRPTPDDVLLTRARTTVTDLHRTAVALARRHPELRPLVRLHAAHLHALDASSHPRRPATSSQDPAAFRVRELAAAKDLADWSVRADSGSLATLFATVSASIAMFYREVP